MTVTPRTKAVRGEGAIRLVTIRGKEMFQCQLPVFDRDGVMVDRISKTSADRRVVVAWRDSKKREMALARGTLDKPITVPQLVDLWSKANVGGKKPRTLESEESALRLHFKPRLNIQASKLTPARVKVFLREVAASAQGPGVVDGRATAKRVYDILHAAMAWGASADGGHKLNYNPIAGSRFPLGKPRRRDTVPFVDVHAILEAAEGRPSHLIWRIFLHTGARRGEILGLNVEHVDLRRDLLKIRQISSPESGGRRVRAGTKTGETRDIKIPAPLRAELVAQVDGRGPGEALFPGPRSRRLSFATVRDWFVRDMKAAGLDEYVIHQLRHTFASYALSEGTPAIVVAGILGHTKVATTVDQYGHVTPEQMGTSVDALTVSMDLRIANSAANTSTTQPSIPVLTGN